MASLMPQGKQQYFTANGIPLVGGKVYTYSAGTTTPLATYTDSGGLTPNANPVILDSRGEASIFFGTANYKIVLQDSTGATIWTQDNLPGNAAASVLASLAASSGSSLVGFIQSGTGAVERTVQDKAREVVSVTDFYANGVSGVPVDPTGVVDSTLGIQAALSSSLCVHFPKGTYKVTAQLTLSVDGQRITGDGIYTTVIRKTFAGIAIKVTAARVTISDVFVLGTSYGSDGIQILGNACTLQNVMVQGNGGNGIRIGSDVTGNNSNSWTFLNVSSISNGGHGVYCYDFDTNCNAGTSVNLTCLTNTGDGINIGKSQVNTWVGTLCEGNTGWGARLNPSVNTQMFQSFIGGDFEANTAGQFRLESTAFLNFIQVHCVVSDGGTTSQNTISTAGALKVASSTSETITVTGVTTPSSVAPTVQRFTQPNTNVNNRNYAFALLNASYGDFGLYQSAAANGDPMSSGIVKLLWDNSSAGGMLFSSSAPTASAGIGGDLLINKNGGAGTTIYSKRIGATLATVVITGAAGTFTCGATTLAVGTMVNISGTFGGTGSITGYVSGTNYYITATNGTTTFTLSATAGGAAITTTAGTPTGLTYLPSTWVGIV
jgi:hypothetical protein